MDAIKMLNKLSTYQDNLLKQLQLVKDAKRALMYKLLR